MNFKEVVEVEAEEEVGEDEEGGIRIIEDTKTIIGDTRTIIEDMIIEDTRVIDVVDIKTVEEAEEVIVIIEITVIEGEGMMIGTKIQINILEIGIIEGNNKLKKIKNPVKRNKILSEKPSQEMKLNSWRNHMRKT